MRTPYFTFSDLFITLIVAMICMNGLFVPNESTKEGMSKSAITIGTKGQTAEMKDRYSLTLVRSS